MHRPQACGPKMPIFYDLRDFILFFKKRTLVYNKWGLLTGDTHSLVQNSELQCPCVYHFLLRSL